MQLPNRVTIKIAGESGQGVNVAGEILAKVLKASGYFTFGYREYPSLIQGGVAAYQLDYSNTPVSAPSDSCNVLLSLSRRAVHQYLPTVKKGGIILHALTKLEFTSDQQAYIDQNQIEIIFIDMLNMAEQQLHYKLLANVIALGVLAKIVELPLKDLEDILRKQFADKPQYLEADLKAAELGYNLELKLGHHLTIPRHSDRNNSSAMNITGNQALALGAIAAGTRAYYSYPMTPTSPLLTYFAEVYHETGMVVKQAEDEITAAQMALGSMFMGTRALTGTSGGGFDLMTETVSLAGMTETPFVCILGQRPGPATGMPTWTSAADLELAIYSGHGEFPRCVISASDAITAYTTIQAAYNLAEKYQIPVILLTDKQIAESIFQVADLPPALPINRGLAPAAILETVQPSDRYKFTDSGISLRWLPGQASKGYVANSDEHTEDGSVTEDAVISQKMIAKRMRKMDTLKAELPEPVLFGDPHAEITFVGWGSVRNSIMDVADYLNNSPATVNINYLHYEYLYPLKTDTFTKLYSQSNRRIILVENNYKGQLGQMLEAATTYKFKEKLLKYDGRPFYVEEILKYLNGN